MKIHIQISALIIALASSITMAHEGEVSQTTSEDKSQLQVDDVIQITAQDISAWCNEMYRAAWLVMSQRQAGMPMSDVELALKKYPVVDLDVNLLAKMMIRAAYDIPIVEGDDARKEITDTHASEQRNQCHRGFDL